MAAFAKGQSVKAVVVQSDAAGRSIGSTCVVVVLVYSYTNRGLLLARGSTVLGGWGCGRGQPGCISPVAAPTPGRTGAAKRGG